MKYNTNLLAILDQVT